jgi:cellulose synthase/poly-beta-1,6-N-acetylglucosamine synthase-like glycosyltransferase
MMNVISWLLLPVGIHIAITWITALWRGLRARYLPRRVSTHRQAEWPSVSIIIPAWQERGTLEQCIASLELVDYPEYEVVIVAGGPDGTYRAAVEACEGYEHFRLLEQQPRGKNAALNAGVRAASGEVIVLLDADSQLAPGWLPALVAPIGGVIRATTGNPVPLRPTLTALTEQMERIAAADIYGAVVLQGSGSIAIDREVIEEIGGFPEDVLVGVDWDLNARLAARGVARACCPDAFVYTDRPATWREYWRNEVRWRRAHLTSLFRLRAYFLHDIGSIIRSFYLYGLAWFSILLTCGTIAAVLLGSPQSPATIVIIWALFVAWLALRRATLAVEVAAYTRRMYWLRLIWMPPLLLFITLVAACVASISTGRVSMHFKGPRSMVERSM